MKQQSRAKVCVVAVLALLAVLVTAMPAAAALTFGPPRTVVALTCPASKGTVGSAFAAYGGDRIRGFAGFGYGATLTCSDPIYYFEGGSQGYTRVLTRYRGVPLGVAADNTATYLIYLGLNTNHWPTGVYITKRDHQGHFFPSRLLSSLPPGSADIRQASVGAYNGHWWAVWTESTAASANSPLRPADPNVGRFHSQLFQAKTVGTPQNRTRITTPSLDQSDLNPSISVDANGAVLAWTRQELGRTPTEPPIVSSNVWVAVEPDSTLVRARAFSTTGRFNEQPDVRRVAGVTYLTWTTNENKIMESDNGTGLFRRHQFLVSGQRPRISASVGSVYVAWTAASGRAYFARGNEGSNYFEGQYVSAPGSTLQALIGVHGTATAVVASSSQIYSVTG